MGNLRFAAAIVFVAACGSDHGATPDAAKMIDAKMIDAKVWMDAPPPTYDFSCYQMTPGTTVAATITLSGTTGEIGQGGFTGVPDFAVNAYKVGSTASAANATSGAMGAFTLGPITTNGTAIEYVKALDGAATPTHRTTFLYPPNPIRADFNQLPVPAITQSLIDQIAPFAGGTQMDDVNGMLFVTVNDCSTTSPQGIDGATIKVQQNNADVGSVFDLGQVAPQAAGIFIVFNVPDGATTVSASYNGMNFPTHTVVAHKKPNGAGAMGTITATAVPPGPIN